MNFFRTPKTTADDFANLLANLRSRLLNEELLSEIENQLYRAQRERTFADISDHGAEVLDPKSGDTFTLKIMDDEITTSMSCWNNHHHKIVDIKFFGDVIAVKTDESTDMVYAHSGIHESTSRKSKVEVYHNDLLFCVKELESSTVSSLDSLTTETTVTETFINDKREAVRKVITAGDEDSFHKTGVSYLYSSEFQVPPFMTVACDKTTYIYGMNEISEEAYKSFMAQLAIKKDNVHRKLYPKR